MNRVLFILITAGLVIMVFNRPIPAATELVEDRMMREQTEALKVIAHELREMRRECRR